MKAVLENFLFGFACLGDGLSRILSLGFARTNFGLDIARHFAHRKFTANKMKQALESK